MNVRLQQRTRTPSHNVPQTSCNALPGVRGSRHNLDQRTLHKLVQRKTGPLEKIATCINGRLHK